MILPTRPNRPPRANERGFSILEALVAITILVIATTGPMVFAQQSIRAARLAGDQVTAFYLAQDAVEFVKHVRDENSLNLDRFDWLSGLEECFGANGCQISTPEWSSGQTSEAVDACLGGDCPLFEQRTADGKGKLYGIFDGTADGESRFSRRLTITAPEGADPSLETEEVKVEVEVTWTSLGIANERRVVVSDYVYNWIQ